MLRKIFNIIIIAVFLTSHLYGGSWIKCFDKPTNPQDYFKEYELNNDIPGVGSNILNPSGAVVYTDGMGLQGNAENNAILGQFFSKLHRSIKNTTTPDIVFYDDYKIHLEKGEYIKVYGGNIKNGIPLQIEMCLNKSRYDIVKAKYDEVTNNSYDYFAIIESTNKEKFPAFYKPMCDWRDNSDYEYVKDWHNRIKGGADNTYNFLKYINGLTKSDFSFSVNIDKTVNQNYDNKIVVELSSTKSAVSPIEMLMPTFSFNLNHKIEDETIDGVFSSNAPQHKTLTINYLPFLRLYAGEKRTKFVLCGSSVDGEKPDDDNEIYLQWNYYEKINTELKRYIHVLKNQGGINYDQNGEITGIESNSVNGYMDMNNNSSRLYTYSGDANNYPGYSIYAVYEETPMEAKSVVTLSAIKIPATDSDILFTWYNFMGGTYTEQVLTINGNVIQRLGRGYSSYNISKDVLEKFAIGDEIAVYAVANNYLDIEIKRNDEIVHQEKISLTVSAMNWNDLNVPVDRINDYKIITNYKGIKKEYTAKFLPQREFYINFYHKFPSQIKGGGYAGLLYMYKVLLFGEADYPTEYFENDLMDLDMLNEQDIPKILADKIEPFFKDKPIYAERVLGALKEFHYGLGDILNGSEIISNFFMYQNVYYENNYPLFKNCYDNSKYWDAEVYKEEVGKLLDNHMVISAEFIEKKEDITKINNTGHWVAKKGWYRNTGGSPSKYDVGILFLNDNTKEISWSLNSYTDGNTDDGRDRIFREQDVHSDFATISSEAINLLKQDKHKFREIVFSNNEKNVMAGIYYKREINLPINLSGINISDYKDADKDDYLKNSFDFVKNIIEDSTNNLFKFPNYFSISSYETDYKIWTKLADFPLTPSLSTMIANDKANGYKKVLYPSVVTSYENGSKKKVVNIEGLNGYSGSFIKYVGTTKAAILYRVNDISFIDVAGITGYFSKFDIIYDVTDQNGKNITTKADSEIGNAIKADFMNAMTDYAGKQAGEKTQYQLFPVTASEEPDLKYGVSLNISKTTERYNTADYIISVKKDNYATKIKEGLNNRSLSSTGQALVYTVEILKNAAGAWNISADSSNTMAASATIPMSGTNYINFEKEVSEGISYQESLISILNSCLEITTTTGAAFGVTASSIRVISNTSDCTGANMVIGMDLIPKGTNGTIKFPFFATIYRAPSVIPVADSREYSFFAKQAMYNDDKKEYYILESRTKEATNVSMIYITQENSISDVNTLVWEEKDFCVTDGAIEADSENLVILQVINGREGYFGIGADGVVKGVKVQKTSDRAIYIISPAGVLTGTAVAVEKLYLKSGGQFIPIINKVPIFNSNNDKAYIKFNLKTNSWWNNANFGNISRIYLMKLTGAITDGVNELICPPQLQNANVKTIGYKEYENGNEIGYSLLLEFDSVKSLKEIFDSYSGKEINMSYTLGIESKNGNTATTEGVIKATIENGSISPVNIKNEIEKYEEYQSKRFESIENIPVSTESTQFPQILIEAATVFEKGNDATTSNYYSYSLYHCVNNTNNSTVENTKDSDGTFGAKGSVIEYPKGAMDDKIINQNKLRIAFISKDVDKDTYINRDKVIVILERQYMEDGHTVRRFQKSKEYEYKDIISNMDSSGNATLASKFIEIPFSDIKEFNQGNAKTNIVHIAIYPTMKMRGTYSDIAQKMKDYKYGKETIAFSSYEITSNSGDVYAKSLVPITFAFELRESEVLTPGAIDVKESESLKGDKDIIEKSITENISGYGANDNHRGISLLGLVSFNFKGKCGLDGGLESAIIGLGLNTTAPLRYFDKFELKSINENSEAEFVLAGREVPRNTDVSVNKMVITRNGFNVLHEVPVPEAPSSASVEITEILYNNAKKSGVLEFEYNNDQGFDVVYLDIGGQTQAILSRNDSMNSTADRYKFKAPFNAQLTSGMAIKIYDNRSIVKRDYHIELSEVHNVSATVSAINRLSINVPCRDEVYENNNFTAEHLLKGGAGSVYSSTPGNVWAEAESALLTVDVRRVDICMNVTSPTAIGMVKETNVVTGNITFDARISYDQLPLATSTTVTEGTISLSGYGFATAGRSFIITKTETDFDEAEAKLTNKNIVDVNIIKENKYAGITISGIYFVIEKIEGEVKNTDTVSGEISGSAIKMAIVTGVASYTGTETVDNENCIKGVYPIDAEFMEIYSAYTGKKPNDITKEDYEFYLKSLMLSNPECLDILVSSMETGWDDYEAEMVKISSEMIQTRDTEVQTKLDDIRKTIARVKTEQMIWKTGFTFLKMAADYALPGVGGMIVSALEFAATGEASFGVSYGGFTLGVTASKKGGISGGGLSYGVKGSDFGFGLNYTKDGGFSGSIAGKYGSVSYSKESGLAAGVKLGKYGEMGYKEKSGFSGSLKSGNFSLTGNGDELGLNYGAGAYSAGVRYNTSNQDYQANMKYSKNGVTAEAGYWSSGKFSTSVEYHDKNAATKSFTDARLSWNVDTKNNKYSTLDGYFKKQVGVTNSSGKLDTYGAGVTGNFDFVTKKGKLDGYVSMNGFSAYEVGMNIDPETGIKRYSTDFSNMDYWKRLASALPERDLLMNNAFDLTKLGIGNLEAFMDGQFDISLNKLKGFDLGAGDFWDGLMKGSNENILGKFDIGNQKKIMSYFGEIDIEADFTSITEEQLKSLFGYDFNLLNSKISGIIKVGGKYDLSSINLNELLKFFKTKKIEETLSLDMKTLQDKLNDSSFLSSILSGSFDGMGLDTSQIIKIDGDEEQISAYAKARVVEYVNSYVTKYINMLPEEQIKGFIGAKAYEKFVDGQDKFQKTANEATAYLSSGHDLGDITLFPDCPFPLNVDVMSGGKSIFETIAIPTINTSRGAIKIPSNLIIDDGLGNLVYKALSKVTENGIVGYRYTTQGGISIKGIKPENILDTVLDIGGSTASAIISESVSGAVNIATKVAGVEARIKSSDIYLLADAVKDKNISYEDMSMIMETAGKYKIETSAVLAIPDLKIGDDINNSINDIADKIKNMGKSIGTKYDSFIKNTVENTPAGMYFSSKVKDGFENVKENLVTSYNEEADLIEKIYSKYSITDLLNPNQRKKMFQEIGASSRFLEYDPATGTLKSKGKLETIVIDIGLDEEGMNLLNDVKKKLGNEISDAAKGLLSDEIENLFGNEKKYEAILDILLKKDTITTEDINILKKNITGEMSAKLWEAINKLENNDSRAALAYKYFNLISQSGALNNGFGDRETIKWLSNPDNLSNIMPVEAENIAKQAQTALTEYDTNIAAAKSAYGVFTGVKEGLLQKGNEVLTVANVSEIKNKITAVILTDNSELKEFYEKIKDKKGEDLRSTIFENMNFLSSAFNITNINPDLAKYAIAATLEDMVNGTTAIVDSYGLETKRASTIVDIPNMLSSEASKMVLNMQSVYNKKKEFVNSISLENIKNSMIAKLTKEAKGIADAIVNSGIASYGKNLSSSLTADLAEVISTAASKKEEGYMLLSTINETAKSGFSSFNDISFVDDITNGKYDSLYSGIAVPDTINQLKAEANEYLTELKGYKTKAMATYNSITTAGALKYGSEILNVSKITDTKNYISKYISYDNGRLTASAGASESLKKCVSEMSTLRGGDLRAYILDNANTIISATGLSEISSPELIKYPLMSVLSDMAEGTNINVESLIKGLNSGTICELTEKLTSNIGLDMSAMLDAYGLGESKYVTIAKNIVDGNMESVKKAMEGSEISKIVELSKKLTSEENEKYFHNIISATYEEGEKGKSLFNDYSFIDKLLSKESLDSMGQRVLSDENNAEFITELMKEKTTIEANISKAKTELDNATKLLSYKGEILDRTKMENVDTILREKLSGLVPITTQQAEIIRILKNASENERNDYILKNINSITERLGLGDIADPELLKYAVMASANDISNGITTNVNKYLELTGTTEIEGIVSAVYEMKDYGIETLYTLESDLNISTIKEEYINAAEKTDNISSYIGKEMKYISNYDVSVIAAELSKTSLATIRTVVGTEIKVIKADASVELSKTLTGPIYSSINANVLKNDMRLKFKARLKPQKN